MALERVRRLAANDAERRRVRAFGRLVDIAYVL